MACDFLACNMECFFFSFGGGWGCCVEILKGKEKKKIGGLSGIRWECDTNHVNWTLSILVNHADVASLFIES